MYDPTLTSSLAICNLYVLVSLAPKIVSVYGEGKSFNLRFVESGFYMNFIL